ncbi:membrane fusion protein, multidrug efflux system [Methylomagnum ishizawai]|uniref:Membrane fusion protein, multidrug efflux system n=1 Tax=Methylomagnum ishizawai TaxID=1760988 RepID=A0A1Y6D7I3_9GAMM|nr:MdtA/MuxA family multidrug efflux RND transporter periplasmic adaptor subunit [Methylomagnum ishizawai]SMF96442.1 membrane fusion protein, multidrug efflux system [Methylomagnum ishizawai]
MKATETPQSAAIPPGFSKLRWLALLPLAALAAWTYQYFAATPPPAPPPARMAPAIPVAAATTTREDFPVYLNGLGTVTALHTVTVRPRVDGELIRVAYQEGQKVKQGELLAEIDPRPFNVQLQQAEGQLARDEALLQNAELDLQRYRTLLTQDSIAAQQVVTQESLVKQYQGTVETDRAQVANAKLQLTYARVTAPITGRVGLRLVDPGNIVQASDTGGLVVITQTEPIAVVFTLPEDELRPVMRRWHPGQEIPVTAYDRQGKNRLAEGVVYAVDNQVDPTTGTFKLKARFPNPDQALFSNQFVNIRMTLDTLAAVAVVPSAAIQHGVNGSFVYVVRDDRTVTVRPVATGPAEGNKTAVRQGLAPGERVVVDGTDKLREGTQVELVQRDGQRQPEPAEPKPEPPQRGQRP